MRALTLDPSAHLAEDRPYPERAEPQPHRLDRVARWLHDHSVAWLARQLQWHRRQLAGFVPLVAAHDADLRTLDAGALQDRIRAAQTALRGAGVHDLRRVATCFALVREASARTLGMRHHPCQLMAGLGLVQGRLIEMATGEGKTFAATLAAATMALAGHPVHVITVNDYLAERDGREMEPLYRFLGLSMGVITHGMDRPARRASYACDIVYCSNKELAFDYLRDRVAPRGRSGALHLAWDQLRKGSDAKLADRASPANPADTVVLRGLVFAIIDEADSVFIDEARTPLILSTTVDAPDESLQVQEMLALARSLAAGLHHVVDKFARTVRLTDAGRDAIDLHAPGRSGWWSSVRAREEKMEQALSAITLFERDRHYMVTEGAIVIVDEATGRAMPDRSWERGLHQFIEAKEGLALTPRRETLARITYQRLLRRYLRLSGMSGTAAEVAPEIRRVYGLDVVRVPLHRPSRRVLLAPTCVATRAQKWQAVVAIVRRVAVEQGRPVLIGTRSVGASEELSQALAEHGIEHALLNARQDQAEADLIAQAGHAGRVTVATNMAGRGTDIRLGPGVAELGGLHVVLTEFHGSARIDRQLIGRCARQHDPGSAQAVVALDDELFSTCTPRLAAWLARAEAAPGWLYGALRAWAQHTSEARDAQARARTLAQDRQLHRTLAFSGSGE
ncbi:prepilin peptidase [Roseateles sp. LYH14W]|uniref:Protein translocase subunit SecA n=1 Tax=Pelomonas parva TaxID=3299032 RepID=A0ABW7FCB1_9BURK